MFNRNRISTLAGLLVAGSLLAGCSSGISVNTDYDPTTVASLGAFESWAWLPVPGGPTSRNNNALVTNRVISAVESAMADRGFEQVEVNDGPDFLVGWHVTTQDRVDVSRVNSFYGYGSARFGRRGGVVMSSSTRVDEFTQGTLIIDIVEASSNELVWRGFAEGRIDPTASPERRSQLVQDAVDSVLERFPPAG